MSAPFHETLREKNRKAWDAMQVHPFVRAIEDGQLAPEEFLRYLAYERDFVGAAIEIFAQALVKAPGFAAQRHLISVLRALAEEQIPYFEEVFATLGARPEPPESFPGPVIAFREGMLGIARDGDYAEILAAMLAAEWMYETWCRRAAARLIAEPHIARWVALHAAADFAAGVAWLKRAVDEEAARLGEGGRALLARRFGEALLLEIGFHTAPLEPATS
ncbi:MAG TPA: TenA family protein [Acetobacteraceae bacterium]|nr:TenA family protein [Acetobacteraceae bacterium]